MNQSIWAEAAPESEKPVPQQPTTSYLSADAIAFAPDNSAPPTDVSSADMYATTGPQQSGLFDDVIPVESMRIRSDDDLFADDFTPAEQPVVEQVKPQVRGSGESTRVRDRGRGRGGRGQFEGRGNQDRRGGSQRFMRGSENVQTGNSRADNRDASQAAVPETTADDPRKETVPSVRGDRHATGGVRKPKLTEEELAEKMAKIQIKNASLTAAHARAEADAASFAEREQQAKQVSEQRRKEERRDRQQMMGEREKNRQRKLKAAEGREWDAEKHDEDFGKGGRFDKRGGFAGDNQEYTDGREYLYREPRGGERGRGSGRGGRGGRQQDAAPPKKEEFPALPSSSKTEKQASPSEAKINDIGSTDPSGKSWADQVEAS